MELLNASTVVAVPEMGCSSLENGKQMAGNIAVVTRGLCSFTEKARNAEAAGAVAVVITDDRIDRLSAMLGNVSASGVTIPAMIVTQAGGEKLRENAGRACTVRIGKLSGAISQCRSGCETSVHTRTHMQSLTLACAHLTWLLGSD
jgi:hypothetical protein